MIAPIFIQIYIYILDHIIQFAISLSYGRNFAVISSKSRDYKQVPGELHVLKLSLLFNLTLVLIQLA